MIRVFLRALAAIAALAASVPAMAQDKWPTRPVRIIVPYAPGGATDIAARIVGDQLRQITGQSFVVENKPGAFGIIAIEEMLRAKPDGYTVMVGNPSTNAITPILFKSRMSYDYQKSVVAVSRLVDLPSFLLVSTKDFGPTSFPELIAYAKANPGKVRYGSAGVGSYPHYSMELIAKSTGIDMVHIPNKGGGSAYLKDMMTGDIQTGTMNVATATPVLSSGAVKPIATMEATRLPEYPDLPSVTEFGVRIPGTGFWHSMFAPAATPKPVLEALNKAINQAMEAPHVVDAFNKNRMRRLPHKSLEEAKTWLDAEIVSWRKVTDEVKIEMTE